MKPKTHRSRRPVSLPAVLSELLRVERRRQLEAAAIADQVQESEWVISHLDNRPWNPDAFTKAWRRLCEKAGIRPVSVHELRHTHITWLIEDGVSLKDASDRAGHSGVGITGDIYAHVRPERRDQVAAVVEQRMRRLIGAEVSPIGDTLDPPGPRSGRPV